jgi:hypothetical protein
MHKWALLFLAGLKSLGLAFVFERRQAMVRWFWAVTFTVIFSFRRFCPKVGTQP